MDTASIERLEKSFNELAPRGPELVERFYANLFAKHPEVRSMFPQDMTGQRQKLLASLALVVKNLRKPHALQSALLELGERHQRYGCKPEHYPVVRDALLDVMIQMAGDTWTEQLTADWKQAFDLVAEVMLEGQRRAVASA